MDNKNIIPLPPQSDKVLKIGHFPTSMQAIIFRNWGMIPKERIALVLDTSVKNIEKQAEKMGLAPQGDVSQWAQKGYITIIRSNWHLLTYEQLLILLNWDEGHLALILKEEDFLNIKLGSSKPSCQTIRYRELTDEEEEKTKKIKAVMLENIRKYDTEAIREPFDFFNSVYPDHITKKAREEKYKTEISDKWVIVDKTKNEDVSYMADRFILDFTGTWGIKLSKAEKASSNYIVLQFSDKKEKQEYHEIDIKENKITITAADTAGILRALTFLDDLSRVAGGPFYEIKSYKRSPRFGARYIYSFCGLYNDAFDVDSTIYCPDGLLSAYAKVGINGIWTQAVLYRMTEFPFEKSISEGWKKRLANLEALVNRAKKYGIKIYLYINEPRSMPLSFFEKYPEMKGAVRGDYACMCTSVPKVQEYLENAITKLCRHVPDLGGFFTITMSENITNCCSVKADTICSICSERPIYEIVAEVNTIIAKGAHSVNPDIRVIAWDWAWTGDKFNEEMRKKCIELLPKDVIFMGKRESEIPFNIGGINGKVHDYSMSIEGISPVSKAEWAAAKQSGHEIAAKVQINNTWECSTVPFLPVFSLLTRQLESLLNEGISHIMLSWTLGGYPSPNIKIASEIFFENPGENEKIDYDQVLTVLYGDNATLVKTATDIFSEAFKEFPFDIGTLYLGPQNGGSSNLLFANPTGWTATMTCYAYDDLESWRSIYPEDVFENQFKLLCEKWEEGLKLLDKLSDCELKDMAIVGYSLFRASYNQIRFVRIRDKYSETEDETLKQILLKIIDDEKELAVRVYRIMLKNPSVGFEAANHYYYSRGMLAEKVINCAFLKELLLK